MDLMQMWQSMGFVAKAVAFILLSCRCGRSASRSNAFTYTQARNQSKIARRRRPAPEGRAPEGRDRAVLLEELPL